MTKGYNGLVYDMVEGQRLASILGSRKDVLMLSNHGVLVVGRGVAETFDRLYYLERAAQAQVYAMWTGQALKEIPPAVIEQTRRQYRDSPLYYGRPGHDLHFDALKRMLDRRNPSYES